MNLRSRDRSPAAAERRTYRVFVSSTYTDLKDHRAAVLAAVRQLGAMPVDMEDFGARDERPRDECLRLVREESDLFVGIYGQRYGFVPAGDVASLTEQEYDAAVAAGLPRFLYLIDDSVAVPAVPAEGGTNATKLAEFKRRIKTERIVDSFTSPDTLAVSVVADLGRYLAGLAAAGAAPGGLIHEPRPEWRPAAATGPWRYKVAAFDLDGTLLRGSKFEFSWEAIWQALGFGPTLQRQLKRAYRRRAAGGASRQARIEAYAEWCEQACNYFKTRGLTRARLREIAAPMRLTSHCREVLSELREAGLAIAIVSGGVSTFLEDAFPDFREHVDFVFINELLFDRDGLLVGVRPTAFDFEGKRDALELVCERVGCDLSEAAFVGDHFNDEAAMLAAGLAIAYPAHDLVANAAAEVALGRDDLRTIAVRLLVE